MRRTHKGGVKVPGRHQNGNLALFGIQTAFADHLIRHRLHPGRKGPVPQPDTKGPRNGIPERAKRIKDRSRLRVELFDRQFGGAAKRLYNIAGGVLARIMCRHFGVLPVAAIVTPHRHHPAASGKG